jgi:oxygen-independent coproporphyrinogen-3 oxidase
MVSLDTADELFEGKRHGLSAANSTLPNMESNTAHHTRKGPVPPETTGAALGVYVHFPWCLQKCPYCDFLSIAVEPARIPHRAYADAVIAELARRAPELAGRPLGSLFFGGGTPSLWEANELGRVLDAVLEAFAAKAGECEITVECNPSSFDRERARALLDVGVNRVSIGVQGLDTERLRFLGRLHDVDSGLRAVSDAIAAGVPRVSADLIFGVAGQSAEVAAAEAVRVAEIGPSHLSAYTLTIEPGTLFGALARKNKLPLLGEAAVADSFVAVEEALESAGFVHYEISNYARDGHLARHNVGYWRGADYLGLGTGAWGTYTMSGRRIRYRNTPSPERYLAGLARWATIDLEDAKSGELVAEVEPIDPETALRERLMLGLRLQDGLDVDLAARELGVQAWTPARERAASRLEARGRLKRAGSRLWIPKPAWLFADGTIADLM